MAKSAIVLAGLLIGQPPVTYPSDPMWILCEKGEAQARIESCAKIANDAEFELAARSWALVLRAAAHAEKDNPGAAILDLDRALRMQPENWIALRLRGDIRLQKGELELAGTDIDRAIEIAPDAPYNLLSRATYLRAKEQYAEARKTMDYAIELDPALSDLYFERGRNALAMLDAEQAILDFEKSRAIGPSDAAIDYNLALGYRLAGRFIDADAAINRALEVTPDDPHAIRQKAKIGLGLGELDAALAEIERAIRLDPTVLSFRYTRGSILSARGEFDAATADFTAALPEYPDDAAILVDRSYAYFRADDDERALSDAEAALDIDPKSPDAHWLKAAALLYMKRHDEAAEAAARGKEAVPDDSRFPILQGRILLDQGNSLGAVAALSEALGNDPTAVDAIIYRATAMTKLGLTSPAREALEGVLETDPENAIALEQWLAVCGRQEDHECALSAAGRLIDMFPDEPQYWWEKANILAALKYRTAPEAYETAVALYGDEAPADLLRGQGAELFDLERYDDAIAALHAALLKEPDDAWSTGTIGWAEHLAGRNGAAIPLLKRAVQLYGEEAGGDLFSFRLADTYAAERAYREALEEYDRLLVEYTGDADLFRSRGEAYRGLADDPKAFAGIGVRLKEPEFLTSVEDRVLALKRSGDSEGALRLIELAIGAAPDAALPYFLRAMLQHQDGALELALADYDHAIERDPHMDVAINNSADILLELNRLDDAHERAKRLNPDYAMGWVTLGQILLEKGDLESAVAALDKAVAMDDRNAHAFYYRALAYSRLGRPAPALSDLRSASRRDDGSLAKKIAELREKLS